MWDRIRRFFKDSETIFLARLQVFLGGLLEIMVVMDPSLFLPLLGGEWFPFFLIVHGFAMEYLRRRRDDDLNKPALDDDDIYEP